MVVRFEHEVSSWGLWIWTHGPHLVWKIIGPRGNGLLLEKVVHSLGGQKGRFFNPASLPVHTLIMTTHETCLLFLQSYPSHHDGWWTANQNTSFFPWVASYQVFDFSSRNVTNTLGYVSVFECSLWALGMWSQKHGSLKSKCPFPSLFRKRLTFLWRFGSITKVGEAFAYCPHEGRFQSV